MCISRSQIRRGAWGACLILAVAAFSPATAHAQTLDEAANALAGQIAKYLQSKNQTRVFVDSLSGPSDTSSGPAIVKALKDKLTQFSFLEVTPASGWKVGGNFMRIEKKGEGTIFGIVIRLFDQNGIRQVGFKGDFNGKIGEEIVEDEAVGETVTDKEDVANLSGVSSVDTVTEEPAAETAGDDAKPADDNTPNAGNAADATAENPPAQQPATEAERADKLGDKISDPTIFIDKVGHVASPFDGSPYRIEILVKGKTGYEPRFLTNIDGFAYTDLFEGDTYALRIYNFSEYDAGVKLSIDGINCFEFSEVVPFRKHGMWVVPRAREGKPGVVTVTGWHHSVRQQTAESFLVTKADQGLTAKLGRDRGAIGTITAMFFAAWAENEPKPPIEKQQSRSGLATDRGPLVEQSQEVVYRYFGRSLLAAVSVRYNKPGAEEVAEDLPTDEAPPES